MNIIDCECPYKEPHPCTHRAYVVVKRKGETLRLCSRCTLTGDDATHRLYDQEDIPILIELDQNPGVEPSESAKLFDALGNAMGGIGIVFRGHLKLPKWGN
jgi:hypothetical protein